jgi:Cu/Ag efflux protein CusF
MKAALCALLVLSVGASFGFAADTKSSPPAGKAATPAEKRHALKGVVTAIDADASALRVKHEEIPGVMRAMTMQFKVDAATLGSVKTGDEITALMSREEGAWRLHEVKVVARKTK